MDLPSRELLDNYRSGDPAAARAIYDRYAVRLIGVAKRMLADKVAARFDPEDIVQSAYRSFFVHAREGQFELRQSGDLWRLLIAITRHKLLHEVEAQTAAKRTPARETFVDDLAGDDVSPEAAVAVADELQAIMRELEPDERTLLEFRLREQPVEKIAMNLGKSPRTLRRMLLDLRRRFERRLGDDVSRFVASRSPVPAIDRAAQLDYRDFELLQMVGAGGFGKVYRARWKSRDKIVAVKSLRKQFLIDVRAVEHFVREADIVATLEHPGIIRSHGLGRTPAGGYFLTLDWHSGGDLSSRGTFTPREVFDCIAQAADAMAHAHARGVIHCDLKPSNLLLSAAGRVVVTDFGFAHALRAGDSSAARTGGTPGFAAPELWEGQAPTPACDVYSLGRVLEYLAAQLVPGMEASISSLVRRATTKEPTARVTMEGLGLEVAKLRIGR